MSGQEKDDDTSQVLKYASDASASAKIPLGGIGYKFHKLFPGHGWFEGTVIEIRYKAPNNKSRRILYNDGDMEDLSTRDIRSSNERYRRHLRKEAYNRNKEKMKRQKIAKTSKSVQMNIEDHNPSSVSAYLKLKVKVAGVAIDPSPMKVNVNVEDSQQNDPGRNKNTKLTRRREGMSNEDEEGSKAVSASAPDVKKNIICGLRKKTKTGPSNMKKSAREMSASSQNEIICLDDSSEEGVGTGAGASVGVGVGVAQGSKNNVTATAAAAAGGSFFLDAWQRAKSIRRRPKVQVNKQPDVVVDTQQMNVATNRTRLGGNNDNKREYLDRGLQRKSGRKRKVNTMLTSGIYDTAEKQMLGQLEQGQSEKERKQTTATSIGEVGREEDSTATVASRDSSNNPLVTNPDSVFFIDLSESSTAVETKRKPGQGAVKDTKMTDTSSNKSSTSNPNPVPLLVSAQQPPSSSDRYHTTSSLPRLISAMPAASVDRPSVSMPTSARPAAPPLVSALAVLSTGKVKEASPSLLMRPLNFVGQALGLIGDKSKTTQHHEEVTTFRNEIAPTGTTKLDSEDGLNKCTQEGDLQSVSHVSGLNVSKDSCRDLGQAPAVIHPVSIRHAESAPTTTSVRPPLRTSPRGSRSSSPKPAQSDNSTCNETRRHSRRKRVDDVGSPKLGQVGFQFEKFFPNHGLFHGMVVEIIGTMRRCSYSDGDQEDITLSELKNLVRLEAKRNAEQSDSASSALSSSDSNKGGIKAAVKRKRVQSEEIDFSESDYDFENADKIVPYDDAAAHTLLNDRGNVVDSTSSSNDEEDPQWLTDVAYLLQTTNKSNKKKSKNFSIGDGSNEAENVESSCHSDEVDTLLKSQISRPVPLLHVKKGDRHGCKVVNVKDKNRIVGQVLLEHQNGWIEVVFGKETKKDRPSTYIAISSTYVVGKRAGDLKISETVNLPSPSAKDKSRAANADFKLHTKDIFYWYCKHCQNSNSLSMAACTNCGEPRTNLHSQPSAMLELAENICIANQGDDIIQDIPPIYRRSLPTSIIRIVQQMRVGKMSKVGELSLDPANPDTYFYWQCSHCTMENSYKRWSCGACKLKKSPDMPASILLEIAYAASRDAMTIADAMKAIPDLHKPAIPTGVMNSLVTCVAIVSRTNRRCQNPKFQNTDYCASHRNAIVISPSRDTCKPCFGTNDDDSKPVGIGQKCTREPRIETFVSIGTLVNNIRTQLKGTLPSQENAKKWEIQCIEDAFLCERNEPFPLGLKVRRYFPGHGYHDGFITDAKRKEVIDPHEENARPILVYRLQYNDGDEEDLLHHEVNSLRQIYDIRNVRPTAPSSEQILEGTKFMTHIGNSIVEVLRTNVNQNDISDKGTVYARVEAPNQNVKEMEIELTKLQLAVVRRLTPHCKPARKSISHWLLSDKSSNSETHEDRTQKPFIEWPPLYSKKKLIEDGSEEVDKGISLSFPGLNLHTTSLPDYSDDDEDLPPFTIGGGKGQTSQILPDSACHTRKGAPLLGHDPAGAYNYLSYNPYEATKCETCMSGEDEHHLLICDVCDKGYHTYCLRPVVVNIPRDEWSCPQCAPGGSTITSFAQVVEELKANPKKVMSFLGLPFDSTEEFCREHQGAFEVLNGRKNWHKTFAKKRIAETVNGVAISRNKDRQLFVLPEPIEDPVRLMNSLTSIVASCKYCGMEKYSEILAYEKRLSESNNDASLDLDSVTCLSKANFQLFEMYKENLKNGVYPPIEVVYDENIGFLVKSLAAMRKHTILTEYVGESTTVDQTGNTSSDSLMNLLQTGDDSTSLIIDPSRIGNMARFFSGINNRNLMSKKKANVRTRRFSVKAENSSHNQCRVVLFTARDVKPGEILHYDYNAGIEGKSVGEIVRTGFYDTSNFL